MNLIKVTKRKQKAHFFIIADKVLVDNEMLEINCIVDLHRRYPTVSRSNSGNTLLIKTSLSNAFEFSSRNRTIKIRNILADEAQLFAIINGELFRLARPSGMLNLFTKNTIPKKDLLTYDDEKRKFRKTVESKIHEYSVSDTRGTICDSEFKQRRFA